MMGPFTKKLKEIQEKENLTLNEMCEKYPELVKLQLEEALNENSLKESKESKLLLG